MHSHLQPQNLIPVAIIAAVAAMVAYANVREGRRLHQPYTAAPPLGAPGAPPTSRDELNNSPPERFRSA